jgi:hypothetical protein
MRTRGFNRKRLFPTMQTCSICKSKSKSVFVKQSVVIRQNLELVSSVVDMVARAYFRHAILKQRPRARISKGRRLTTSNP